MENKFFNIGELVRVYSSVYLQQIGHGEVGEVIGHEGALVLVKIANNVWKVTNRSLKSINEVPNSWRG
jgi:hypothetical protein